jgi:thiamine biosynthesis lipoprotein
MDEREGGASREASTTDLRVPGGHAPSRREMLRITAATGIGVAAAAGLAGGLLRLAGLHRVSETRTRMGTLVTITVVSPDLEGARRTVSDAFVEMARLEGILSRHRSETPLGMLNATGVLDGAPAELLEVLRRAREHSVSSGGAFDVTVAPLLALYASRFERGDGVPTPAQVRAAAALVDYRGVHVAGASVRLGRPGMAITLDGIAKGYIVDRTLDVLVASGAERVLVDAGGDMASGGARARRDPWSVGVQDPHRAGRTLGVVRLGGACIATSGDYLRTFTEDRRHHHIIDPRTGRSPDHTSSVTVVAATAMDADALSTAVFVLGAEEGAGLLARSGADGLVVSKTGERFSTTGFGVAETA